MELDFEELVYLNALNLIPCIGPTRLYQIKKFFNSFKQAFYASYKDFKSVGFSDTIISKILTKRNEIDPYKEWKILEDLKIKVLYIEGEDYPEKLKTIYKPPIILYQKGDFKFNHYSKFLAVVGTRNFTSYGKRVIESIVYELIDYGFVIVSGLALGIDSLAHLQSVKKQFPTIAVLGSSLERIYPTSNLNLANKILEIGGCLISEFPLGTPAFKQNFPFRNRVISGLSNSVLIVEAGEKSGALITAKFALDQGRDVFVVPGDIFREKSKGCNFLIKHGAKPITKIEDILEEFELKKEDKPKISEYKPNSIEEAKILELIKETPLHIDEISVYAKINPSNVLSILTKLELLGIVKNLGDDRFIRI